MKYLMLSKIKDKKQLKKLSNKQLKILSKEIRHKLIDVVYKNGGHLSSNLGVVELTLALHISFDTPIDTIVFDVGHQSYTHKILTGRLDVFNTIRKENGISGFTNRNESEHDAYISGHSGVSISSSIGMATAKMLKGDNSFTIAVIGDGALTSGIAYEGLNNISNELKNLIIVLNDNEMSISNVTGSMSEYLNKIRTSKEYFITKNKIRDFVKKSPLMSEQIYNLLEKSKNSIKTFLYDTNFFDDLGFKYIGPIDGHNIDDLINVFDIAKAIDGPVFIHVVTKKGKGYNHAENNPILYHGISKFDPKIVDNKDAYSNNFSNVFGKLLTEIALKDKKVCAVTAAMSEGTGLIQFEKVLKDRFFDVSISEQHAVSFCCGLSLQGLKPVFAVYSTFLQRAFDQLIHDVNIQNVPMIFCIDRAGIVGDDGETHQGIYDILMIMSLSNFVLYLPSNYNELKYFLENSIKNLNSPIAIRYPRGSENKNISSYVASGKDFDIISNRKTKICIVTYGRLFSEVYNAVSLLEDLGFYVDILKINKVSYNINEIIIDILNTYEKIFIFEEALENYGIGSILKSKINKNNVKIYGIKDCIIKQSSYENILKKYKLDFYSIFKIIKEEINS